MSLLFLSTDTSDEAETLISMPALDHSSLLAKCCHKQRGLVAVSSSHAYLHRTHLAHPLIFGRISPISHPALLVLDLGGGCALGAFLENERNRFSNVGFVISTERFLVKEGTTEDGQPRDANRQESSERR